MDLNHHNEAYILDLVNNEQPATILIFDRCACYFRNKFYTRVKDCNSRCIHAVELVLSLSMVSSPPLSTTCCILGLVYSIISFRSSSLNKS